MTTSRTHPLQELEGLAGHLLEALLEHLDLVGRERVDYLAQRHGRAGGHACCCLAAASLERLLLLE